MKTPILFITIFFLLYAHSNHSQETNDEIWAFVKIRTVRIKGQCQTLFISQPFVVPNATKDNYYKIEQLAEEELESDLKKDFLGIKNFGHISVNVQISKNKAYEFWERTWTNERKWAIESDFLENCEPVEIEWSYKGKKNEKSGPYSIYEEGWSNILETDSINQYLEQLKDLVSDTTNIVNNKTSIRQRPMKMYKNGKLIEFYTQKKTNEYILSYMLFANESFFLLHGDPEKLEKRYADERPYLYESEQIIDYMKLLINTIHSEKLGRGTIITRKRLKEENFELRQKELDWTFILSDPKVLFESRDESIISAFVYIDNQLIDATIKLDRKHNNIDVLKKTRLLVDFGYNPGINTDNGILFENSKK